MATINLMVRREDGSLAKITLQDPVVIRDKGENLSYIASGNGFDYYFTKDGFYDGWGTNCVAGTQEGDLGGLAKGLQELAEGKVTPYEQIEAGFDKKVQ